MLAALLGGCADTRYYLQSLRGHWALMQAARPLDHWLADPQTAPALKPRLQLAQRLRAFSVAQLHLPDNASYHRYADLNRHAVVWNVVAAPAWSLELHIWCFAVVGCVSYRGYFSEADAREQAQTLQAQGLEVHVYGVPAYSTLGWSNWVGGDPLLNTFLFYPEGDLARLMFHELAHQVLYVQDDTVFNESFATAVARLGGAQWLAQQASAAVRQEDAARLTQRREFSALTQATRARLLEVYKEKRPLALAAQGQVAIKNEVMQQFKDEYAQLKVRWGGDARYDAWVAGANNAALGAQAAYDEWVPAFEVLFEREGRDWRRFYDAVKRLGALPAEQRIPLLQQLTAEHPRG